MTTLECAIRDAQLESAKEILKALAEDDLLLTTNISDYEQEEA